MQNAPLPGSLPARVIFTFALIACIVFIFSNSMQIADCLIEWPADRVLDPDAERCSRRLGMPGVGQPPDRPHRAQAGALLASICWKASCSCSACGSTPGMFVQPHLVAHPGRSAHGPDRRDHPDVHADGRSSQVTDVWLDFSGVLTGILVGLFCLALCRMCYLLYKHRNED